MIDLLVPIERLLDGDWAVAALRLAFIGLIYLFLFTAMRATVRELHLAARMMPAGDGDAPPLALEVEDGASASFLPGELVPLLPRTVIGRGAGADVVVDDPHVSVRHAEVRFERGQWWLRDLGSRNGTILNGEPVRAVVGVRAGDVLQCGRVRFRLVTSFSVPSGIASA
ncbi:MAG: FHA domain-containing protein [Thermomicrobiales bacterium]|nr:FHA domain-containing protein [Thermomicrobiales bacterium]